MNDTPSPQTRLRSNDDIAGGIRRMIRALGDRFADGDGDTLDLPLFKNLQAELDGALTRAVIGLRDHGYSDAEIAADLGVTRAAVSKRWPGGGRYVGAAGRYRKLPGTVG